MSADNLIRHFCTLCFADTDGGSWGCATVPEANHCMNCGAGHSLVPLEKWAIESIRKNASWVGKRYYPSKEDKDLAAELRALRKMQTEYPGRSVALAPSATGERNWTVTQRLPGGLSMMVFPQADSAEEAWENSRASLPWVSKEALEASP